MLDLVDPLWLVFGVAAPAVVAGAATLLAHRPAPAFGPGPLPQRAALAVVPGLGLGLAMFVGIAAAFGPPHLLETLRDPLRIRWQDGLSLIILAAMAVEGFAAAGLLPRLPSLLLRLALAAAAPWLLLAPIIRHDWTVPQTLAWTSATAAGLFAMMALGRAVPAKRRDMPFALALAIAAAGGAIALSGSLSIGQFAFSLAAAVAGAGGAGLAALRAIRAADANPPSPLPLIYGCILIVAYHYTFDPYHHREGLHRLHALLLASPLLLPPLLAPLLTRLPPARPASPGSALRAAVHWLLTLTPAALAAALAAARNS